jgi:hypothetical protein
VQWRFSPNHFASSCIGLRTASSPPGVHATSSPCEPAIVHASYLGWEDNKACIALKVNTKSAGFYGCAGRHLIFLGMRGNALPRTKAIPTASAPTASTSGPLGCVLQQPRDPHEKLGYLGGQLARHARGAPGGRRVYARRGWRALTRASPSFRRGCPRPKPRFVFR